MSANIRLDTSGLDALQRRLNVNGDQAVAAVAFQLEATVKGTIISKDIIDTGALLNSIHTEKRGEKVYWVADGVEYGVYHELGTHRMAARPFMTPAVEKVNLQIADIIKEELGL